MRDRFAFFALEFALYVGAESLTQQFKRLVDPFAVIRHGYVFFLCSVYTLFEFGRVINTACL